MNEAVKQLVHLSTAEIAFAMMQKAGAIFNAVLLHAKLHLIFS